LLPDISRINIIDPNHLPDKCLFQEMANINRMPKIISAYNTPEKVKAYLRYAELSRFSLEDRPGNMIFFVDKGKWLE